MQKPTGVRWELRNSLAILSHFLINSCLLPSYKITKQFTFLKYQQTLLHTTENFLNIKMRVRFFKFVWGSWMTWPHCDEKRLYCYSSAWDIITGTCQSVTGWDGAAAEDLSCECWPWTQRNQRTPELVFCGCLTAGCSTASQSQQLAALPEKHL